MTYIHTKYTHIFMSSWHGSVKMKIDKIHRWKWCILLKELTFPQSTHSKSWRIRWAVYLQFITYVPYGRKVIGKICVWYRRFSNIIQIVYVILDMYIKYQQYWKYLCQYYRYHIGYWYGRFWPKKAYKFKRSHPISDGYISLEKGSKL